GSLVELSPTREMRGDLPPRERVEEGGRVAVVPDQDREVAVAPLVTERFARDDVRDLLGLVGAADFLDVVDLDVRRLGPALEMLVDAEARLEPIRVVLDQAVRRIEQALRRAAVLHEGDHGRVGVRATESLEIPERGAAPGEDRLIVVADRGDVSMRLDEEA